MSDRQCLVEKTILEWYHLSLVGGTNSILARTNFEYEAGEVSLLSTR